MVMKKLLTLFCFCIFSYANAQNYFISFDRTGITNPIDSIKIENLQQSTSLTLPGSDTLHLTGTSAALHSGLANTNAVVAACSETGIAARICAELSLNAYTDWYLPSKDELNLMFVNLKAHGLGAFTSSSYWSSTEQTAGLAWNQYFGDGYQGAVDKPGNYSVRAIRAF